jgi:hypothetical protein
MVDVHFTTVADTALKTLWCLVLGSSKQQRMAWRHQDMVRLISVVSAIMGAAAVVLGVP